MMMSDDNIDNTDNATSQLFLIAPSPSPDNIDNTDNTQSKLLANNRLLLCNVSGCVEKSMGDVLSMLSVLSWLDVCKGEGGEALWS